MSRDGPRLREVLSSSVLCCLILLFFPTARADPPLPPTLEQIQEAIQQQGAHWSADANPVWNLSWEDKAARLGCLFPERGDQLPAARTRLLALERDEVPGSWDWRDVSDTNYVSPVKDQSSCGSCWAFAACAVIEAMRMIEDYPGMCQYAPDHSEQFLVSCDVGVGGNLGCHGGYPDRTANYLRDTGVPDEACYAYKAQALPCSLACDDWQNRVRKIFSWSYVRDGGTPSGGAIDSMKAAIYQAPVWTTMRVFEDFYSYESGVYEYTTGKEEGGHAICMVGYDDVNQCFICKNSWGAAWGENGFFRIGYSQVSNDVAFGGYTIAYCLSLTMVPCHRYEPVPVGMEWIPATDPVPVDEDDEVTLVPTSPAKYFCATTDMMGISSNGWLCTDEPDRYQSWPEHYPIPGPEGPRGMIAPLWTDLNPAAGGEILTRDTGDGRFVVEYRQVPRKDTGAPETFEVVFYDQDVYPTKTRDSVIRFQYLQHDPQMTYQTVGIENHSESCGIMLSYNGQGVPIYSGMAVEFRPVPVGDEYPPESPGSVSAIYSEPFVEMEWVNPSYDDHGFELTFLGGLRISRDGETIAERVGQPGEWMSYRYREALAGPHEYGVSAYVGTQVGEQWVIPLSIPTRLDYVDHYIGNVTFTVTDQGICGFMDGSQTQGSGFIYGPGGGNCLYVGGLWVANDSLYALNRDYLADPYDDWLFYDDFLSGRRMSDQDHGAMFDDGGHPYSRGLVVRQESWAWADAPDDDYVILCYTLRNAGAEALEHLYAGQFMDWDIPADDPYDDQGGTDPDWRLVYMWRDADHPYVGVALLDSVPGAQAPAANLTLIHNPTFVWPQASITEQDRYLFLTGGDPSHSVPESWELNDWGALVSAGPFDLVPGDSITVAFAVAGGVDAADLRENIIAAHLKYGYLAQALGENPLPGLEIAMHQNWPNPFSAGTTIRLALPARLPVELYVHDIAGRRVRTLLHGVQGPGERAIAWDGRDENGVVLPSGVYFCHMKVNAWEGTRRLVVVR